MRFDSDLLATRLHQIGRLKNPDLLSVELPVFSCYSQHTNSRPTEKAPLVATHQTFVANHGNALWAAALEFTKFSTKFSVASPIKNSVIASMSG
ncbi:hypothetical protein CMK12_00565 [Candidatus Poribacteria bacterium]|jgi:hypothetical protein|nr:hypothetical protein [Candidatus Poribacteria bacterium]